MSRARRVVSSQAADVFAAEDVNLLVNVPPPSPLNLFEKFHSASKDFSEWLLPPESPANVKPIGEEVAAKLRLRQSAMSVRSKVEDQTVAVAAADVIDVDADDDEEDTPIVESVSKATPSVRGDAREFHDGEFFSFGPTVKSEKEAASSSMTLENLQAVVEVPTSAVTGRQRRQVNANVLRRVPLWSVERFRIAGGYCESNALVALHEEIMDLVDYLSPSQAEVSLRRLVELEISRMSKALWPECEPCVYGSLTTHLLLPLSDIDMSILNVPPSVTVEEALTALAREIGNSGMCTTSYPQLILKTKVPLLKFTHKGSLLDVDVSINAGDGKTNSEIVRDCLRQYPEARPLVIVVKYFLQQRDMHEPYHGGLGSFATTLLVISFLQHHPIYTSRPHERAYTGLGKLLVDFFRYYGCCFNHFRCGVSLENGGFYFLRRQNSATDSMGRPQVNQVVLEDPGNRSNNAASSLRQFPTIASSFAHAYSALTAVFPLLGSEGEDMSPDAEEIARRPTLLSRILHIDAESVARRKCIVQTFTEYQSEPALRTLLERVGNHCRELDAPMIARHPLSKVLSAGGDADDTLQPNTTAVGSASASSVTGTPTQREDRSDFGPPSSARIGSPRLPSGRKRDRLNNPQDDEEALSYYSADPKQLRPRRVYHPPQF